MYYELIKIEKPRKRRTEFSMDEKEIRSLLWADVNAAKQYLKTSLGLSEYNRLVELFYHVCVEEYAYKVLITRRAYLLFELFLKIFQYCFDELSWLTSATELNLYGEFYNSHSMCLLKKKLKEESGGSVLIVDDIIINGRAITEICDYFGMEKKHTFRVWVFLKSVYANCLNETAKEHLTTYKPCSEYGWKDTSKKFTKAIQILNKGYTSYIDNYFGEFFVDDAFFEKLAAKVKACGEQKTEIAIFPDLFKNETSYAYFINPKQNGQGSDSKDTIPEIFCLRFYKQDKGTLIIPYLFVNTVETSSLYNYAIRLLRTHGIQKIPSFFKNCNKTEDEDILIYFFKWTINAICRKKTLEYLGNLDCIPENLISIEHSLTYKGLNPLEPLPKDDDLSGELKIENSLCDDDISWCRGVLNDEFKKSFESFSMDGELEIEINHNGVVKNDSITGLSKIISQSFTQYSHCVKEEDERRAKLQGNAQKRCKGISANDICLCALNHLEKYIADGSLPQAILYGVVLSVVIKSWDCGESSYNFCSYDVLKTETNKNISITSGLIRNGEQVFMGIYEEFADIYPYFYEFTKRTLACTAPQLSEFGKFLITALGPDKQKRVEMFAGCLQKNSSYRDDVMIVEPEPIDMDGKEIVNRYVTKNYT